MSADNHASVGMRCEFTLPPGVDVVEPPSDRGSNPRLDSIRRALGTDGRWTEPLVESVRQADGDGWTLVVWLVPRVDTTDAFGQACSGVDAIVTSALPGASILACSRIDVSA